uniref:Terpene synthase n=1 Tax=Clitopilus sp. TaxID=1967123 RepID=A0A4P2VS22_9AGAR|nr:putative sesquiterpene synthase [Clitopilus sp.]
MSESNQHLRIPHTLTAWPWPRTLNPYYQTVKAESSAWLESFKAFDPKAQAGFNSCDFNLLASLAYPLASKEHLRTGCDLMNLFFVIDEYTDIEDEVHAAMVASVTMDALRNPFKPRPRGEIIIGEIARQFWARTVPTITEASHRRFIETFDTYLQSVVVQARDRSKQHIRSIQDYLHMRRDNIGAKPSFAILELSLDLPDYVMSHPSIQTATVTAIDMLIIGNDLCSFRNEHARGDDTHNILTIARHEFGQGLGHAVNWIESYNKSLRRSFLSAIERVPSWGEEIDTQVAEYLYGLANWVRANDCWSFESHRYFGKHGREIQVHRVVDLACGHPECVQDTDNEVEKPATKGLLYEVEKKTYVGPLQVNTKDPIAFRSDFPLSARPKDITSTPTRLTCVALLCTLSTFIGWLVKL